MLYHTQVPEMDQLLDQSVVQEAQNYRHRMELMFRSSQKNQDRFNVLTFNNPVPNLNNMTGEESVARYMPSWIQTTQVWVCLMFRPSLPFFLDWGRGGGDVPQKPLFFSIEGMHHHNFSVQQKKCKHLIETKLCKIAQKKKKQIFFRSCTFI